MNPKPTDEQLRLMQAKSRLRHTKVATVKKPAKKKIPKKRKRMKQRVKVKRKWEYPVEKLREIKPMPEEKETFQEKQARIKAIAEKVNKAIGLKEDEFFKY